MTTKVNEESFADAKKLFSMGAMLEEVARFTGLSVATVTNIKRSESLADYKRILNEYKRKSLKKSVKEPETPKQTVIYKPTWEMMQEIQKTNELLKGISSKLAFIVEELCGVAKKEG